MASTCGGSRAKKHIRPEEDECPGTEEDWENLEEEVKPEKIEDALKHLGNVKKRKLSPMILKDILGDDGDHCLSGIKKSHEKLLNREVRKLKHINVAVSYFEDKMDKRRKLLSEKLETSSNQTYPRRNLLWMKEWRRINDEKCTDTSISLMLYEQVFGS